MNSGAQVIDVAIAAGLRIRVDSGNLRIAPASLVTPELHAALSKHKSEILELLKTAPDDIQSLATTSQSCGNRGNGAGTPVNHVKTEAPLPMEGEKEGVALPPAHAVDGWHPTVDGGLTWAGRTNKPGFLGRRFDGNGPSGDI
jgi:hypothetical protein